MAPTGTPVGIKANIALKTHQKSSNAGKFVSRCKQKARAWFACQDGVKTYFAFCQYQSTWYLIYAISQQDKERDKARERQCFDRSAVLCQKTTSSQYQDSVKIQAV